MYKERGGRKQGQVSAVGTTDTLKAARMTCSDLNFTDNCVCRGWISKKQEREIRETARQFLL